jgi:hypothetical protein
MIISAGYNIAGPEVEQALLGHPDVLETAVVAAPDPARGSIVAAFVVLRDGVTGDAAKVAELQEFAKRSSAPYKYPRRVEFVRSLPKTNSGKISVTGCGSSPRAYRPHSRPASVRPGRDINRSRVTYVTLCKVHSGPRQWQCALAEMPALTYGLRYLYISPLGSCFCLLHLCPGSYCRSECSWVSR